MRRIGRMTMAVAAVVAGAGGLGLLGAAPAGADTSSGSGAGAATGASQLGGYQLAATGSGLSIFYEQPNFPLPATPTAELDFGYSTASYSAGPVGSAQSSVLWPGPIVGYGGSQLPLLLNPYLQQYLPQLAGTISPLIPNPGNYPVVATTAFPQGPQTASNNNGPLAMDASSTQSGSQASSSVGRVGGPASESALPSGLLSIQALGSTSQSTVDSLGNAVAEATSTVHGIDIGGGLIQIGTVTSTATGSSDGNQGKVAGTSTATGITVAGEPVTVDSSGLHVVGNSQNPLAALIPSVNTVLQTAGITIALTNPTDTVNGASAARQLDGLSVTINLSTYDDNFNKLVAMLPKQLTSALVQLPVPSPYKQVVTLDFGWVNVNSAASPAFTDLGGTDLGGSGDNGGTLATLGSIGTGGTGTSDLGIGPTGTASTGPSSTGSTGPSSTVIAAAPAALFKGVGTGLIILGLLLAAVLVALLLGADRAVGSLAAGTVCAGEDPLNLG